MNRVEEIFKAWRTAFNPSEAEKQLAALRMEICNSCEHKQKLGIVRCGLCGCPLHGKVHSPVQNACPAGKWGKVDKEFFESNYEFRKKQK